MNSIHMDKPMSRSAVTKSRRPYVVPIYKRVNPDAAKELLSRNGVPAIPK